MQFKIDSDDQVIVTRLYDNNVQVNPVVEHRLPVRDLKDYMTDMNMPIKELWFPFNDQRNQGPHGLNDVDNFQGTEARIAFNYNYS